MFFFPMLRFPHTHTAQLIYNSLSYWQQELCFSGNDGVAHRQFLANGRGHSAPEMQCDELAMAGALEGTKRDKSLNMDVHSTVIAFPTGGNETRSLDDFLYFGDNCGSGIILVAV